MRRCRSRKRWLTDFRLRVSVSSSLTWAFTCAYPVIDRMFMVGSTPSRKLPSSMSYELQIIQPAIGAGMCHQAFVRALVGDHAVFQHQDAVGAAHGRQAMGDHEHGAAGHQVLQGRLHQRLRSRCRAPRSPRRESGWARSSEWRGQSTAADARRRSAAGRARR